MGNTSSNSDSDDHHSDAGSDDGDDCVKVDADGPDDVLISSLAVVFRHSTLRELAAKIRDDVPENVVQQHQTSLQRWLEDRVNRNEDTVTLAQFTDALMNRGVSRQECLEAFAQFDEEGDGIATVENMLETLKSSTGAKSRGDITNCIRRLQACSLMPGFIDVYADKNNVDDAASTHGIRLLNFLLRNRAPSESLPFQLLEGFNNTTKMRQNVLSSMLTKMKERADKKVEETMLTSNGVGEAGGEGEELKLLAKCYSFIETSTNKTDVYKITDGDPHTFWQSDGSARSHWIRLRMKQGVVVKHLSITVAASDQTYMPQLVVISAGRTPYSLKEIKEVRIPSQITGDFVLMENARMFYRYIQINIRRCHSDGCDVKIRGLKTVGVRPSRDPVVSVTDASAVWFLQILAATAQASRPISPHLQPSILEHTQNALRHIPPLALSPNARDKPGFLSPRLLQEVDAFLKSLILPSKLSSPGEIVTGEGLHALLSFALARGNVVAVIDVLIRLLEFDLPLPSLELVKSMNHVCDHLWRKHGSQLDLGLLGTDSGQKDEKSGPQMVLTGNWANDCYLTREGVVRSNMLFCLSSSSGYESSKTPDPDNALTVQLTKLRIRVQKGGQGPRCGLVFIYGVDQSRAWSSSSDFNLDEHLAQFAQYDDWDYARYASLQSQRRDGELKDVLSTPPSLLPVAWFSFEDDWDETDVNLDECHFGQFILIKFLRPRTPSVERLGIVGIKFYGYKRKPLLTPDLVMGRVAPIKEPSATEKALALKPSTMFMRVLSFLVDVSEDQMVIHQKLKASGGLNESGFPGVRSAAGLLDFTDMHLDSLLRLLDALAQRKGIDDEILLTSARVHVVLLLHILTPILTEKTSHALHLDSSEKFLKLLCAYVDGDAVAAGNEIHECEKRVATITLTDGAAVFFPDKEARRKQLFSMMTKSSLGNVEATEEAAESTKSPLISRKSSEAHYVGESVTVIFQSLCQFFSNVDPAGLLNLPRNADSVFETSCNSVLGVMETMLSVAYKQAVDIILTGHSNPDMVHFNSLLSSLQMSLLSWCHQQILSTSSSPVQQASVFSVVKAYTQIMMNKAVTLCRDLLELGDAEKRVSSLIEPLESTFMASTLRILIVTLSSNVASIVDSSTRVHLLQTLMPLASQLEALAEKLPGLFYRVDSEEWHDFISDDVVLRTWDIESPHNYENNQHSSQIFCCPGATSFYVEFDPRCETERKYDYLEFTESDGNRSRYDQKCGTASWPLNVTFKGGHRLHFLFHSDSSNNEWGYKFKVIAKGPPDIPLCWIYDLQLSVAKLFGELCGATIRVANSAAKPAYLDAVDEWEDEETLLLHSELWSTLFRSGYVTSHSLVRSLSGWHSTGVSGGVKGPQGCSLVFEFIRHMLSDNDEDGKTEAVAARELLKEVRSKFTGLSVGGTALDEAVIAIFGALIWHTQVLREEVERALDYHEKVPATEGLQQAYQVAESMRMQMIEQRQKMQLNGEKDCEKHIVTIKEKALFLLKFAGLNKVETRAESAKNRSKQRARPRRSSLPSSQLRRDNDSSSALGEKFPAFRLILEFLRDSFVTKERVDAMLQERTKQARAVASVYKIACDFLTSDASHFASDAASAMKPSQIFQVPTILFLQQLFAHQDSFPKHYADGLEGCGLELEASVRTGFYQFIRKLHASIANFRRLFLSPNVLFHPSVSSAYICVLSYFIHFLDMKWQPYDLTFLSEINFPLMLMDVAKSTVAERLKTVQEITESEELDEYKLNMQWWEQCKTNSSFNQWYNEKEKEKDADPIMVKKRQMFISKYSDLLEVEISCDGCGIYLPGRRYRCMQCEDVDLCSNCFTSGVNPTSAEANSKSVKHSEDHDMIHMMFKCDECNCFITGTRIHCNLCEDFDLCLGCYKAGHFPAGHNETHDVATHPRMTLRSGNQMGGSQTGGLLQSYIHQHVWLLFSSFSLSVSNMLHDSDPKQDVYFQTKEQIHVRCVELLMNCLLQNAPQLSRSLEATVDDSIDDKGKNHLLQQQEEIFGNNAQERIMGLLGAMLPLGAEEKKHDIKMTRSIFVSEEFLFLLYVIAFGESGHEPTTQHLAMGLLGHLLVCSSPTVSDAAMSSVKEVAVSVERAQDCNSTASQTLYKLSERIRKSSVCSLEPPSPSDSHRMSFQRLASQNDSVLECIEEVPADEGQEVILPDVFSGPDPDIGSELSRAVASTPLLLSRVKSSLSFVFPEHEVKEESLIEDDEDNENDGPLIGCIESPGLYTVEQLIAYGSKCLEKSGTEWAHSMAQLLGRLAASPSWLPILNRHVSKCIDEALKKDRSPTLELIFCLYIIAGFPEIISIGSLVKSLDPGSDGSMGIVVKYFPLGFDKATNTLVVDLKTRKQRYRKERRLEVIHQGVGTLGKRHWTSFVDFVISVKSLLQSGKLAQSSSPTVETLIVVGLCLKSLLSAFSVKDGEEIKIPAELFDSEFVKAVVFIASRGTDLSRDWTCKQLEILALNMYTSERSPPSLDASNFSGMVPATPSWGHKSASLQSSQNAPSAISPKMAATEDISSPSTQIQSPEHAAGDSSSIKVETESGSKPNSEGDAVTRPDSEPPVRTFLSDFNAALQGNEAVATPDDDAANHDADMLRVLEKLSKLDEPLDQEQVPPTVLSLKDASFITEDMVKSAMMQWFSNSDPGQMKRGKAPTEPLDTATSVAEVDTGILLKTPPQTLFRREIEQAMEELSDVTQKLIVSDAELTDGAENDADKGQEDPKHLQLFKKTLEARGGRRSRLLKINMALAILYARKVLAALLAHWPYKNKERMITAELLSCKDEQQIPCVLDLLQKSQPSESFKKVIRNVIQMCHPKCLLPMAITACHFMEEISFFEITRESEHKYTASSQVEEKINIPGATFLSVRFDARCCTEGSDVLSMSSASDFSQNKKTFSGGSECFENFDMPGDTLFYRFESTELSDYNEWGYKFTVQGGRIGRFQTGYMILKHLLVDPDIVVHLKTIKELWACLVYVACRQTGSQRLKTVELLLIILRGYLRPSEESALGATALAELPSVESRPELTLLEPLWRLFAKMSKNVSAYSIAPSVHRALTELFFLAENLAITWGVEQEYFVAMTDLAEIRKIAAVGFLNVAAVGLMINFENKATTAVICGRQKSPKQASNFTSPIKTARTNPKNVKNSSS